MTSLFPDQISRIGARAGGYRIIRFIGSGGMGEVYEALHATLNTRHAIKFLRRELVRRPDLYARFEQEARIAGTLSNRHIVKVRDFGLTDDGLPFMVMDLADGRSLASILSEQRRLKVDRAVDLIHQACVGLSVAHAAKIVHRDLKPENLFVCAQHDGTELLKILDFGIAKHFGAGASGPTTETGSNLGTAHYMSPEQAQGARHAIDHRTDIYALGVILYELLSGKKPHDGDSYNEILIRIVTQKPVPLDEFCPNLPRELVNIVHQAMARDPSNRFQAAREFASSLARLRTSGNALTGFGISLQPASRPRSPDWVTLAAGSDGRPNATASTARDSSEPKLTPRLASTMPWPRETRWTSLGLQFFYALVGAAAVTAAGLWLMRGRTVHRSASPMVHRAPNTADLPTVRPASVNVTTSRAATAMAAIPPNSPQAPTKLSTKPSGATSTPGQPPGQSRARRSTAHGTVEQNQAVPTKSEGNSVPTRPTIDDPLPSSPHAPGVSPVME